VTGGRAAFVAAVRPFAGVESWARGSGLVIVLVIVGAILAGRFVRWLGPLLTRRIDVSATDADQLVRSEAEKHRHALVQVAVWTLLALIYTVAVILVIPLFGIPLNGFVAPAAVVGVALGFGAQGVVQDLLTGFFVITERQYGFGDLIRISVLGVSVPVIGTVEDVSLRITTVRSADGEVVITPNGHIVQVTNLSRNWARAIIDVPVALTTDVRRVSAILRRLGEEAFASTDLRPLLLDAPSVMGVESIDMNRITIRMVARTLPGRQFEVGRDLRALISQVFLQEGINLPTDLDTTRTPVA
jgi:small-conductance mechanosensitive channel